MHIPAITGTGVFTPSETISNAELVAAFNAYAHRFNERHAAAIAAGEVAAKPLSSEEFILKASGIESRHVMNKSGVLDRRLQRIETIVQRQQGVPSECDDCRLLGFGQHS